MKDKFKEVYNIFQKIMKYNLYKFKYLPQSTLFKANQLHNEAQGSIPKYFPKFKRGTVVYVKFGINIGAEISGNHFAIVLDKYDKETKSTITVVPLSSKNKNYYQKLHLIDNIYIKNSQYHLNKIDNLIAKWKVDSKQYLSELDTNREYYSNKFKNYVEKLLIENNGIITPENQQKINFYSEELINQALYKLQKGKEEFLESQGKHYKGIIKYEKYKNKDSFACINMIQTIDKRKLTPLSKFESAGNIIISNESMDVIEERIKKFYFTFDK
ncbi:type II toxin-antitoxin system PemK/MazF family toxin [Gemella massiliensis]|uniref:type II toxin-antitoxin system PemK/MazF family toxin n=1 Tax=Gemella massiliensis TaxID=1909670 RepID=UPI0009307E88|nr:type II toxin-antitoxin system PemK/MazF family toxin [Gemella massiliensis]